MQVSETVRNDEEAGAVLTHGEVEAIHDVPEICELVRINYGTHTNYVLQIYAGVEPEDIGDALHLIPSFAHLVGHDEWVMDDGGIGLAITHTVPHEPEPVIVPEPRPRMLLRSIGIAVAIVAAVEIARLFFS